MVQLIVQHTFQLTFDIYRSCGALIELPRDGTEIRLVMNGKVRSARQMLSELPVEGKCIVRWRKLEARPKVVISLD